MAIRIFSDSTCDLGEELTKRYSVTIIPLCIVMGETSYFDGEGLGQEEIFRWSDENRTTPKTAAFTQERLEQAVKPALDAGDDCILFTIASGMSSSYSLARIYAEDEGQGRLHVIDSANLSTGIGLLVIKAAEMAGRGVDAGTIVKAIEETIPRVRASFVIDTLTFLSRGGRCSSVTALLAGTLKLHPEIAVRNGAMGVEKKYRGSLEKAVMKYVHELEAALRHAEPDRVFITHTLRQQDREIAEKVREYLETLGIFSEILETCAGGVVSSHCGPGTLGVLFIDRAAD
ncbi:MAG: DegV family protein [Lachnospiraceae bacterium]|nr:DegV family protein [Lachnospiraceae bacterium]